VKKIREQLLLDCLVYVCWLMNCEHRRDGAASAVGCHADKSWTQEVATSESDGGTERVAGENSSRFNSTAWTQRLYSCSTVYYCLGERNVIYTLLAVSFIGMPCVSLFYSASCLSAFRIDNFSTIFALVVNVHCKLLQC